MVKQFKHKDGTDNTVEKRKEKLKEDRYSEKKVISKFLVSDKGFPFLFNLAKSIKFSSKKKNSNVLINEIEQLIDVYTSWTFSFPSRKNLKVSKYDFLKSVEDFCADKDNITEIKELFGETDDLIN